jgi:hypothetical protein
VSCPPCPGGVGGDVEAGFGITSHDACLVLLEVGSVCLLAGPSDEDFDEIALGIGGLARFIDD